MRRLVQLSCLFGEKPKGEMTIWVCAKPEQEVVVIHLVFTLSCGLGTRLFLYVALAQYWWTYTNTRRSCWCAETSLWLSGDLIWGGVVFVFPTVLAAGLTSGGGDCDPSHLRNWSLENKRLQPSSRAQLRNMQTEKAGCLIHPLNVIETETAH